MHLTRFFPVAAFAALLSSCATPTEYRADASHPIRTITIAPDVPEPKRMTFVGLSEAMGMGLAGGLGGAVGAGIAAGTMSSRHGSTEFAIGQAVRAEFADAIAQSGKFTLKNSGPADAELQLAVNGYGFYQAGIMARRVRPILGVDAKLVRRDGTVVWQHRRAITHLARETPAFLPEKIRDNPAVGAKALRDAARTVARRAVGSIQP
jgi:hypothetical protein